MLLLSANKTRLFIAFCCLRRYCTQTRAIGAFASVGFHEIAEACRKGWLDCLSSCAFWRKRRVVNVADLKNAVRMELQEVGANNEEGDSVRLIHREQV
jgi:hypothetical protein